jgi:hypothetical protein
MPTWDSNDNANHVGDLWHYSGDTDKAVPDGYVFKIETDSVSTIKPHTEWMWSVDNGSYFWVEMQVPDEVFDLIDGTSNIFAVQGETPSTPYNVNDVWILDWDGNSRPNNFPNFSKGTLLVSTVSRDDNYNSADWIEKVKYKD